MSVSIKYKGSEIASMAATGTKTLLTSGKYCEADIIVENTESGGGGGGSDHTVEDAMIDGSFAGTYENARVTQVGKYGFAYKQTITSASFPNAVKIMQYAFASSINLTTINIPKVTEIETRAFSGCSALTSVSLQNVEVLGASVFLWCTALTALDLPKVKSVGEIAFYYASVTKLDFSMLERANYDAFQYATALETLILRGQTVVAIEGGTSFLFTESPIESGNGYIYVPAALVASYKAASSWTNYVAQIRAIEDYPEITGG